MPDIGELKQVQQGTVRISTVSSGTLRPAFIRIASVEFPEELYEGDYSFTPGAEAQIVRINGKIAQHDITIEAIPSTWGRITWNGGFLTVS